MLSLCADSLGAISLRMASSASFVSAELRLKKTCETRSRTRPERSSASSVFSNVGASADAAMASTSASCSSMPRSNAGR